MIDWTAGDADAPSHGEAPAPLQPQSWRHRPLAVTLDMTTRLRAARTLHNAAAAYRDELFHVEHRLAGEHFDAIARGDAAEAAELEAARIALGFETT